MGGIIKAITGKDKAADRAKKRQRAADAAAKKSAEKVARRQEQAAITADRERAEGLAKQKSEEALLTQARGKRRVKAAGRKRRVFTSPLGLTDTGTQILG